MLDPADDGQQARNSVVQGCAISLWGHAHFVIMCLQYTNLENGGVGLPWLSEPHAIDFYEFKVW